MELEETMQLTWLGHAAFYIQASDDSRIVIDPYESGSFGGAISYPAISVEADAVFTTHQHADHAATDSLPGKPELYAEEETATVGSVDVTGFHTFHDTTHGSERGGNTIYVLEDNDLRLVHLGDLGHELGPDAIQSIGRVDVLLAPVGGLFTIDAATADRVVDALHPRVVIPMHYKTPDCGFDLAPVEDFLKTQDQVERWEEPTIILDPGSLPRERTTIVLPYVS